MVVDTFGLATGGRPRRTGTLANFSGQPFPERSGASSRSKPWCVEGLFPFIGFPHADNTMRGVARCPDEDHHPPVKKPYGDEAILDVGVIAFSHRRMSLKTGVGAFCVAGAPFWFFGFDLGTGESSSGLWDCGNRGAISKGGGKRRETWFWFSSFSIARHFHSPLPAVQHGVFAERKLANSFCLARCIRRAAAVSLSAWAMRPRASSLCPGLR